jgi:transposase
MRQPTVKKYPAAFKESAVKPAVESDRPMVQTVRDLGINENTPGKWISRH